MRALLNTLLVLLSVVIGLLLIEILYRAYLWIDQPQLFAAPPPGEKVSFGFYDKSHWEYDEELGYVYPAGREIMLGNVVDDRLVACDAVTPINARGNIGPIRGDYDSAKLKILLFGDSFPAYIVGGETFPAELQARLNETPGVDAHVVNFGRDGTGILQMLDHAAKRVPEWQPDLVIVTFISDDLDRVRIWRTAAEVDGEPRILVSDRPNPDGDMSAATDAFVWFPEADMEWCRRTLDNSGRSPELDALLARYRRMKDAALASRPGPASIDHSFVLSLLLQQNPLAPLVQRETWQLPRVAKDDYRDDADFVAALAKLQQTGIPMLFIHLPIAPELMEGSPNLSERQKSLWASLEAATGQKAHRLSDHIVPELTDPIAISHQPPVNHHPSPYGMKVYANAIARILAEDGFLPGQSPDGFQRPPEPKRNVGALTVLQSDLTCPFRLVAGGESTEQGGTASWTVFRSFIGIPPARVTAIAARDGSAVCRFEVEPVPTPALNGFDWRIGHAIPVRQEWAGRTAQVSVTLQSDVPMRFDRASVYSYDGDGISYRNVETLGPEPQTFTFDAKLAPGAETFELWFRMALESAIEPAGTVTMSDPVVSFAADR